MTKLLDRALLWFRRDLRADDHAALYHALRSARQVWCAFVFDRDILDPLPRQDRRVEFIRDSLLGLDAQLRALGSSHGLEGVGLIVRHGRPADEVPSLAQALGAQAVYANHDDGPWAPRRSMPTMTTTRPPWRATRRCVAGWPTSAWPCTPPRTTWSSSATKC